MASLNFKVYGRARSQMHTDSRPEHRRFLLTTTSGQPSRTEKDRHQLIRRVRERYEGPVDIIIEPIAVDQLMAVFAQ